MNYPWIIDITNEVYSYSGTEWIKQDANAIDIVFQTDQKVFQLTPYGEVY